jgi:hypothetical protein
MVTSTHRDNRFTDSVRDRYSRKPTTPLIEVHSALASLLYACNEELRDLGGFCELRYTSGIYLTLEVECSSNKAADAIVARLCHGVLWGEYDYRFKGVCKPLGYEDGQRRTINASVDLHHG